MTSAGGAASVRCRACGVEVPRAARCERCSAPLAILERCPSCGGEAGASPHKELRFACDLCGGPRVPHLDPSLRTSGAEAEHLRAADAARKARAGWYAAAIADGVLLPFMLVILGTLVALLGASAPLVVVGLLMVAPTAAFLAFALRRAAAAARAIGPALDGAWLAAATDLAQQIPGLSASVLAEKLGIAEPQAEELIALVDVNASLAPQRLRIQTSGAPAPVASASGAGRARRPEWAREAAEEEPQEEAALAELEAVQTNARIDPPAGKS